MAFKIKNLVLIVLVVIIWGFIGVKVFYAVFSNNNTVETNQSHLPLMIQSDSIKIKSFEFIPVKRDPFLGKVYSDKRSNKKNSTPKRNEQTIWPNIKFKGVLKSTTRQGCIYVIDINSSEYLVRLNQDIEGVFIKRVTDSKIILEYKGETKEIKK